MTEFGDRMATGFWLTFVALVLYALVWFGGLVAEHAPWMYEYAFYLTVAVTGFFVSCYVLGAIAHDILPWFVGRVSAWTTHLFGGGEGE